MSFLQAGPEMEPPLKDAKGKPILACRHCGGERFVQRFKVSGTIDEYARFDGYRSDNTGMWDTVRQTPQGKPTCEDCGKPVRGAVKK